MERSYYQNFINGFLKDDEDRILGIIAKNNEFELEDNQRRAWIKQIKILKSIFRSIDDGFIAFEYIIPRMGKRIDNIFLYRGIVFLLEFKVGSEEYYSHDIDQVYDYGLDLKNFHEESLNRYVVPILVSTNSNERSLNILISRDKVFEPICCNEFNLIYVIEKIAREYGFEDNHYMEWIESRYRPTPTIIEAAQALYKGHNVKDISRSDSGAKNLNETTDYINEVIDDSKKMGRNLFVF